MGRDDMSMELCKIKKKKNDGERSPCTQVQVFPPLMR